LSIAPKPFAGGLGDGKTVAPLGPWEKNASGGSWVLPRRVDMTLLLTHRFRLKEIKMHGVLSNEQDGVLKMAIPP